MAYVEPETVRLAGDRGFWPACAASVLEFARRHGLRDESLHRLTVVVSQGAHAPPLRAALAQARAGERPRAWLPPRITTLGAYAATTPADAHALARRAELFAVLRSHAWVRANFGDRPAALWALARQIAALADEMTLAALDDPGAFALRFEAALARHFRRRAARVLEPQAQLVLQLWRALHAGGGADDPAAALLSALRRRAEQAARTADPLVLIADRPPAGWLRGFLELHSRGAPTLLIEADHARAVAARPRLAAAWPELAGAALAERAPLARRAAGLDAHPPPLRILAAASLEDEASVIAEQVLAWLRAGARSIALVALDRVVARRVRALLERAQVLVRDETGWKLATTSAAGAVMRWLDLASEDVYWRDLLDWLKSPFTLADLADKAVVVVAIERAIRASGALRGARAIGAALAERAGRDATAHERIDEAVQLLRTIDEHARTARHGSRTLAEHARTLAAALDALGMRKALALDPVGRAVLRELDALAIALDGDTTRVDLAAFRALIAERFEETGFVDDSIDSPIVLLSLAATVLRDFDAALLVGADAEHLPATAPDALFMSNAVRAELGLATAAELAHEQHVAVASLLARVPEVAASWCSQRGAEPNALAPLLDRLRLAHACADGEALVQRGGRSPLEAAVSGADSSQRCGKRPAPRAAGLLPERLSASGAQSLVDCAYQFYARHLLGLRQPDDVVEEPAKREFGEALHAVLYRFHREWGAQDFAAVDTQRLRESLARHVQAVFAPRIARLPAFLGLQVRCEALIDRYVEWLQRRAREGWRWSAGERMVEASFALDGQRAVVLHGRIDRIDTDRDGHRQVIDYKARPAKDLKQALAEPGEDLQLPFYGLLLASSPAPDDTAADSAAYVSFDGTTAARAVVCEVAPDQPLPQLVDVLGARLRRDLQRIAGAAPLPAIGAATVCANCEMRGLCRRDYWSDDDGALAEEQA
jgi:ATP-dependent helicase/nuclease subunit B